MHKLSPAMRQYYDAKQQHPDALIMFRMGDFYESFGEDAATMARELDITLTTRGRRKDAPGRHTIPRHRFIPAQADKERLQGSHLRAA